MAVIAREVLWCNTAECDGPAIEDPEDPGNCDECAQPLEWVEVVRADAYRGAVDLLRDVANSAPEFEDPRMGYVVVQIDRPTWEDLAPYRTGGQ